MAYIILLSVDVDRAITYQASGVHATKLRGADNMTLYTSLSKLIYVGNFPELDTNESVLGIEGSTAPIIGTKLSGLAANQNVVTFDYNDVNNNGRFEADHVAAGENLTVNGVSSPIDNIVSVQVALTFLGGSTENQVTNGFQLANGDFYLGDFINGIEGKTVTSLEVTAIGIGNDSGPIADFQNNKIYDLDNFTFVACFDASTRISTAQGERPIGSLVVGDLVITVDNGLQPVRWISHSVRNWDTKPHKDKPILFSAGSLGAGLPRRNLMVSPQHRMLIKDSICDEGVFIPAKKLTDMKGVRQMTGRRNVDYVHIMFDAHQVVLAEGAPSESFYPGPSSMKLLPEADKRELLHLFPQIATQGGYPPAREIIDRRSTIAGYLAGGGQLRIGAESYAKAI